MYLGKMYGRYDLTFYFLLLHALTRETTRHLTTLHEQHHPDNNNI
jgi:hypothetical protein